MQKAKGIILNAIASRENLVVITGKWGARTVFPKRLEKGVLYCNVILVEKPGDAGGHRPDTILVKDMLEVRLA